MLNAWNEEQYHNISIIKQNKKQQKFYVANPQVNMYQYIWSQFNLSASFWIFSNVLSLSPPS